MDMILLTQKQIAEVLFLAKLAMPDAARFPRKYAIEHAQWLWIVDAMAAQLEVAAHTPVDRIAFRRACGWRPDATIVEG